MTHHLFLLLLTLLCITHTISINRRTIKEQRYDSNIGRGRRSILEVDNEEVEEYALVRTQDVAKLIGAGGILSVWSPNVVLGDASFSSLSLYTTAPAGGVLDSIEAGWVVRPDQYGDSLPRLFTYWTSDSYNKTGCFNLVCEGFVQVDSQIVVGAPISPVSSISNATYEINLTITKDPTMELWSLLFGERVVGYWLEDIFTKMKDWADKAEWGGIVVTSRQSGGGHTRTEMGSGKFPEVGYGRSAHMHGLTVVDKDKQEMKPRGLAGMNITFEVSNPKCYNIGTYYINFGSQSQIYSFYGGPGRGTGCP